MTPKELEQEVWKLIDDHCMDMSQEEWLDFLLGIRDDADTRAETVQSEIDNAE